MTNGPRLTFVLGGAVVALSAMLLYVAGTGEEGLRAVIRATARTSLVLFLLAFGASSLRYFVKNSVATAWLLKNRRFIGLAFVVSHAIHLAAIVDVAIRFPHPFMEQSAQPLTLVGGGAGYVGLALMALTSWDGAVRKLGKHWRTLHLVGSWLLWIIFAQSYAGRAFVQPWPYALVMTVVVAVALLRLARFLSRRAPRSP